MSTSIASLQPKNVTVATYAADKQVLSAPGVVFGISGYNSGAAQFIQIHDSATTPADTAVPIFNISVGATSNYSIDFGIYGMAFLAGIYVCNSSTAPTKTIGSANCQFFARVMPT